MTRKDKTLLIVDDSEIDRMVLKNILCNEFDIIEADSGYSALEIILQKADCLDAILLDVSMPVLDGFGVLQLMKEKNIDNLPVFMITAEATRDNVQKATQFNISEFIKKPFEREDILKRLRLKLGVISNYNLTETDIEETYKYMSDLEGIYNKYLANFGEDNGHYRRITDLMKILLKAYSVAANRSELDRTHIEIISKAGYFCDIGNMVVSNKFPQSIKQEEMDKDAYQSHTVLGADIIRLNYSKHCKYFIQICTDICIHHHERYDGKGFPHKIAGENNLIYTQICRLADRFDSLFFRYRDHSELQFDFVVKELARDEGAVSKEVFSLLAGCKHDIIKYYSLISQS